MLPETVYGSTVTASALPPIKGSTDLGEVTAPIRNTCQMPIEIMWPGTQIGFALGQRKSVKIALGSSRPCSNPDPSSNRPTAPAAHYLNTDRSF